MKALVDIPHFQSLDLTFRFVCPTCKSKTRVIAPYLGTVSTTFACVCGKTYVYRLYLKPSKGGFSLRIRVKKGKGEICKPPNGLPKVFTD